MPSGCENSESTVVYSGCWPMRGTGACVIAAGWPTIFTTYMGGAGTLWIGESTTAACGVFAEDVTRLDMRSDEKV